jgi:hypothetical protein
VNGIHVVEELAQGPLEADARHDGLHLAGDARDLALTQREDLVGRHVRRRVEADQVPVRLRAVRQRAEPRVLARARQVLGDQEVPQPAVRGVHLVADHAREEVGKAPLLRGGEAGGERADRSVEEVLLDDGCDAGFDLADDAAHKNPRQDDAALEADAHVRDGRVDPVHVVVDALQPALVVLHRAERLDARPARELTDEEVEGEDLVHRHQHERRHVVDRRGNRGERVLEPLLLDRAVPLHHAQAQPVGGG